MKYLTPILLMGFLFAGCGKDNNNDNLGEIEQIQQYLTANNLTAQTSSSGLQYIIEEPGTGGHPDNDGVVIINFKEFLLNGTVIAQSNTKPIVLLLAELFAGLKEGISLLQKGGKALLLIPSSLAFGSTGSTSIPPNTPIAFEIELVDFKSDLLTYEIEQIQVYLTENNLTAESTESGLHYVIEEAGTGGHPTINSTVTVNYKGFLLDKTVFDQSNGTPISFPLTNVIQGWQEGIPLFQKGGKGILLIPSSLAYGNRGSGSTIPPNTTLVFEVSLVDFQ